MQHNLDWIALGVVLVALAPVVSNSISEDATVLVESRGGNAASDVGIPLETVLGVLVPEVERAVRSGSAKGSVDGMEGDIVDSMYIDDVVHRRISMAFE